MAQNIDLKAFLGALKELKSAVDNRDRSQSLSHILFETCAGGIILKTYAYNGAGAKKVILPCENDNDFMATANFKQVEEWAKALSKKSGATIEITIINDYTNLSYNGNGIKLPSFNAEEVAKCWEAFNNGAILTLPKTAFTKFNGVEIGDFYINCEENVCRIYALIDGAVQKNTIELEFAVDFKGLIEVRDNLSSFKNGIYIKRDTDKILCFNKKGCDKICVYENKENPFTRWDNLEYECELKISAGAWKLIKGYAKALNFQPYNKCYITQDNDGDFIVTIETERGVSQFPIDCEARGWNKDKAITLTKAEIEKGAGDLEFNYSVNGVMLMNKGAMAQRADFVIWNIPKIVYAMGGDVEAVATIENEEAKAKEAKRVEEQRIAEINKKGFDVLITYTKNLVSLKLGGVKFYKKKDYDGWGVNPCGLYMDNNSAILILKNTKVFIISDLEQLPLLKQAREIRKAVMAEVDKLENEEQNISPRAIAVANCLKKWDKYRAMKKVLIHYGNKHNSLTL